MLVYIYLDVMRSVTDVLVECKRNSDVARTVRS